MILVLNTNNLLDNSAILGLWVKDMRKKFLEGSVNRIKKKYPDYDQDKIEAISYGLEALYITFTKTIVIFSIAFCLGIAKDVLLVLISYNIIRTVAFGMHAKKSWHCYIISFVLFIGAAFVCKYIYISVPVKYVISFIAFVTIVLYAPADTYKRPLVNKYKRRRYKISSIVLSAIYLIFIILLKDNIISNYLCIGLLDASLMIHPVVYRMFQLPYNNFKEYTTYYG